MPTQTARCRCKECRKIFANGFEFNQHECPMSVEPRAGESWEAFVTRGDAYRQQYQKKSGESFQAYVKRVEATIDTAKGEILKDVVNGHVPATCKTFSELHDYVDANEYGHPDIKIAVLLQEELHKWIVGGALRPAGGADTRRTPRVNP